MKRTTALLLAVFILVSSVLSGCSGDNTPETEQKINVFTSHNYVQKDFVIQLATQDYIDLVDNLTTNKEETVILPIETPDYIVQYMPLERGGESVYWWLWCEPEGSITLVNRTENPDQAYIATEILTHDFGHMIEEATDGQGPKCC